PLYVEEELVAPEAAPERPRLDSRQIDLTSREDLKGVDQGTGMVLAEIREDEGRAPRSGTRCARPLRRHPDEAGDVVRLVLDPLAQDCGPVEPGCGLGAERRPWLVRFDDGPDCIRGTGRG